MTQLYKPQSSVREAETDKLFSGIWIRWRALTGAERFVCANIVLLPVWWVAGYWFMPLLLPLGIALYELLQYGKLHLKHPSLSVVALFAFGTYQVVQTFILRFLGNAGFASELQEAALLSFSPAFLLWYIQSNNIRIRFEVVAWACTVSVIQMLGLWFACEFLLPETFFFPARPTLWARLTGITAEPQGYSQHNIVPYTPRFFLGEAQDRYSMFFVTPEFFGLVSAFMGIVALDIKNRFWSWLLLLACAFLMFISATRNAFVAFPIVMVLRYLIKNFGKPWGPPIIFALTAIASFTILSIPPITNLIIDTITHAVGAVNGLRESSSETRFEVYRQTWEGFKENPFWGYGGEGPPVIGDIRVGSHSFILGGLLYQNGLVGTVIFTVFWISLLLWFYKTRAGRPLTCFCAWLLYTLVSPTMSLVYFVPISSLFILLCATIRSPKLKPAPDKRLFKKLNHA